jgi:hypothetical protein
MANRQIHKAGSSKEVLTCPATGNHFVQVYQDNGTLTDSVCHFVHEHLQPHEAAIIIATPAHRKIFEIELLSRDSHLEEAIQRGQIRFFDADLLLSSFMVEGMPDQAKCRSVLGEIFDDVCLSYRSVRVYGEMVDILWQHGQKDAANVLEEFWNSLLRQYPFSLLCAYHIDNLDPAAYNGDIECLCSSHTHFLPSQDFGLLEQALNKASENVMGVSLSGMMDSIAKFPHPTTIMPSSQASLLYISKTMPVTTEFILKQVRQNLAKAQNA